MFSGSLKEIEKILPHIQGNLAKAFTLMEEIDFTTYADGVYELAGDTIVARISSYATEPAEKRGWEKHDQYIDIQLLGRGRETIGYATYKDSFTVVEDRLSRDDIAFYSGVTGSRSVTLTSGEWVVLFPWEVHKPNCNAGTEPDLVQKIVLKVKM